MGLATSHDARVAHVEQPTAGTVTWYPDIRVAEVHVEWHPAVGPSLRRQYERHDAALVGASGHGMEDCRFHGCGRAQLIEPFRAGNGLGKPPSRRDQKVVAQHRRECGEVASAHAVKNIALQPMEVDSHTAMLPAGPPRRSPLGALVRWPAPRGAPIAPSHALAIGPSCVRRFTRYLRCFKREWGSRRRF